MGGGGGCCCFLLLLLFCFVFFFLLLLLLLENIIELSPEKSIYINIYTIYINIDIIIDTNHQYHHKKYRDISMH